MLSIAHRGYSSAYPENSALAFEKAIAAGAAYIETDVRLTRDGELVCWHDPDLQRLAKIEMPIADLDWASLATVALPQNQRIQRLERVLTLARGRAGVVLDVKVASERMADSILALLTATDMMQHAVYGARSIDHLEAVRRRNEEVALLAMPSRPESASEFLSRRVAALRYWEDEVTPQRVQEAARRGAAVWVTAGLRQRGETPGHSTVERLAALAQMGVAAVLVNNPEWVSASASR